MHAQRRIAVVLVDGREVVRLGLRTLLRGDPVLQVVGEAGSVAEAAGLAGRLRPGLVVTAAALPDGSAADLCRELAACSPQTRVIILTADAAGRPAAAEAGARGCLSAHLPVAELLRALGDAVSGPPALSPADVLVDRTLREDAGGTLALTEQEHRVLALVTEGKTNREIAAALGLSEKTVKNHLSRAFEKLNVTRRAQAAVRFVSGFRDRSVAGARPPDPGLRGKPESKPA